MEKVLQVLQEFGLTFVPLFVAMDAIGVLPILVPLTQDMKAKGRRRTVRLAGITALGFGPPVLTTLLILVDQYSIIIVIFSFILNLVIAWLLFAQANRVVAFLGQGGGRATSKIVSLFLAAIAIKMIRQGVMQVLG